MGKTLRYNAVPRSLPGGIRARHKVYGYFKWVLSDNGSTVALQASSRSSILLGSTKFGDYMISERKRRIQQILKLEIKQAKTWHVEVQRRIDRLKALTNYTEPVDSRNDPTELITPLYVEPTKRSAGEYASYLALTFR